MRRSLRRRRSVRLAASSVCERLLLCDRWTDHNVQLAPVVEMLLRLW